MARTKPTTRVIQTRSSRTETRSRAAKRKGHNAVHALLDTARNPKTKSKTTPSRKKPQKKKTAKTKLYAVGKKVRVWWPPTRNKKRTDFSGAYWPAKVVESFDGGYRVEYDNLEREDVHGEDVSPASPPVAFGEELTPLGEKEFCEVFNASETDPSAWLAQICKIEGGSYQIVFPFHDSEPETVPANRVRRARVFDEISRSWKIIKPGQEWEDGEISSPNELELIDEATLPSAVASLGKTEETKAKHVSSEGQKCRNMGSIMNGIQKQQVSLFPGIKHSVPVKLPAVPEVQPATLHRKDAGSRTKRKDPKDPNAPKKPRSAYVFFMENERKAVRDKNPSMRPQHIMKLVGENWAKLRTELKEQYHEMARADKARYADDMKGYAPPEVQTDEPGAKRARMDGWPRKPLTAFMFFSKEYKQQLESEMAPAEKTRRTSEAWREMTEEQKESYQTEAREDKERYDRELEELTAEPSDQVKIQQALIRGFASEVHPLDFQPRPLTRTGATLSSLDEESKKTLEEFDLRKVRDEIMESFLESAYYTLLDVWREASPRVGDALRAYKAHISGHDQPDWKAFFTSVVGVDITQSLLKPSTDPPPNPPVSAAPSSPPAESDQPLV